MLRPIYSILLYLVAPIAFALTVLRGLRNPAYRDRLGERFGFTRLRFEAAPIWVHAVSVGEVQAAAVLIRALLRDYPHRPVFVTTATPTGAQRVRALFSDTVRHCYLPYDLPGSVSRFLQRTNPRLAIVLEREIWPNLYRECGRRRIQIVLASARLSPGSMWRSAWAAGLVRQSFANVMVAAQTEEDAERFRALGAQEMRTRVTGNLKFDLEVSQTIQHEGELIRARQFPDRSVWIAGSTHDGEEVAVLDAHERVRSRHDNALLILVPRHPDRFEQVKSVLAARKLIFASRSKLEPIAPETSVLLIDTLGELLLFYAASDVAFVAGSLAPIGGHNLLEPAALALPIVIGPHNFNAPDIADLFLLRGAAIEVADAGQLAEAITMLFGDRARCNEMGEQARAIVEANRGALARVMSLIDPLIR